jgi:hypothetical protein
VINKYFASALSAFILLVNLNTVSAQVTFNHDQELLGEASDDLFGWSVDLSGDGNTIIVGAIGTTAGDRTSGV